MINDNNNSSVQLFSSEGKWTVRIVENGDVAEQRYETHEFASSFATGQAIRLGVAVTQPRYA